MFTHKRMMHRQTRARTHNWRIIESLKVSYIPDSDERNAIVVASSISDPTLARKLNRGLGTRASVQKKKKKKN